MGQASVREILRNADEPLTAEEIAESSGVAITTARASIKRLRMGREVETITKSGKSRYSIKMR